MRQNEQILTYDGYLMTLPLEQLDTLIDDLRQALTTSNWDEVSRLNTLIKPTIAPVMAQLEAGELQPDLVRERLADLQTFCNEAEAGAKEARAEAEQALKEVNRNRTAARSYADVSDRRPK